MRTYEPLGLARLLAATMQGGLEACWTQLQAVRIAIDEYAQEFDGEDPLCPNLRGFLTDALKAIEETHEGLARYVGPSTLPDDHSEALALVRTIAEQVLG